MKTKYLITLLNGCLMIAAITSCKKAIDVGAPVTSVSNTTVFSHNNTAIAAQLNLYASMADDPWNYHLLTAMSSDEYTNFSTGGYFVDAYHNSLTTATDPGALNIWSPAYNYLYRVNSILEGVRGSSGLSAKVKQQTTGEALFMRAYWYFYLTNFYGDVPLALSTDYKINTVLPRTPQTSVFDQVIRDLQCAQVLLNKNYVDATDTAITTDHIRPTHWAAVALLARTYLYKKNWVGADSAASAVIGSGIYQLSPLAGTSSVFTKNSTEAIWQITPDNSLNQFATPDGVYTILSAAPSSNVSNCSTISPQLMAAFEPGDQRQVNWIGSFTDGTTTWYFPYKYKDGANATTLNEYTMILRLAEQYLIRSEARVYEGNTSGALADLNIIRTRAGLANYAGATDQASLLAAILHERQVELFSEGHRWFDLRRTGSLSSVLGAPGNVNQAKGGLGWQTYQQYYPIPLSDIQTDPNLTQTPGYN